MKRLFKLSPLTLALVLASSAHAQDLPSYDRSLEAPAVAPPASARNAPRHGAVASWDTQRGVPTFFWADAADAASLLATVKSTKAEDRAWAYVKENAALYGLGPLALSAAYVKHVHDTGRGGINVIYGQKVEGIEVFRQEMKVLLDRGGLLVAIGGNLHRAAAPIGKGTQQAFSAGPAQAISAALSDVYGVPTSAEDLLDLKQEKDGYRFFDLRSDSELSSKGFRLSTPSRAKKVFFAMPGGLVPAYYLEIFGGKTASTSARMWGYVVAAKTGEILLRHSLTSDAAFKYKVWADDVAPFTPTAGPQADFTPHPTGIPDGSLPAFVPPTFITIDGFNTAPGGGSDPWLDANAMQSTGNNVDAYADLAAPDGFSGNDVRATLTGPLTFDRTYDTSLAPASSNDQIQASVTQLFYSTNWQHDYWYDSGFNESAGNAQQNNFGRGGVEGDPLHVEAQDYGGLDSANMNTPVDGQSPVMQCYLTSAAALVSELHIQPSNLSFPRQAAAFGPGSCNVSAPLVLVNDGINPVTDGCEAIQNNVAGKIALIDRGMCTFESQVLRAQQAGAVGVLIVDNQTNSIPDMLDDPNTNGVTIGSFGLLQGDGDTLKAALLNGPVTVSMSYTAGPMHAKELDGDVVSHEFGHYLHFRLVALGSTQSLAQSEGWADFVSTFTRIHEDDDVVTGTFPFAVYSTVNRGDAGYFGYRRLPYTRDFNKNGLTFKHMTDGVALPAGPRGLNKNKNFETHNAGEVWSSMLFQAYTNLLLSGGHPFTETKRRMADDVVAGMKLAPLNPTFTEQRDALLAAAAAADPNDFVLLGEGFAARGAGTCAVSPPRESEDGSGIVEDFHFSGRLGLESVKIDESIKSCDNDGVLDRAEIGKLTIAVRNSGVATLTGTQVTVTTSTPGVTFPEGNVATIPSIVPSAVATAVVNVAIDANVNVITFADFIVTVDNAESCTPSVQDGFTFRTNTDDNPDSSTTEDAGSDKAPWTHWGAPGYESIADTVWSREFDASNNYRFYGQDYPTFADNALVSPPLAVGSSPFIVTFKHAHDFESAPPEPGQPDIQWDGGLIELTSDGGVTWQDVNLFAMPGYNGTIAVVPGADNPIGGRAGFVVRNPSWPAYDTVTLDFGTAFTDKIVQIRFRLGADAYGVVADFPGWYIDDIAVSGINNKPFRTITADKNGCNAPPVVNAGMDLVVDEGTQVELDGSASSDPNSDPLTYQWSQTAGPAVVISGVDAVKPTFTAPLVDADTQLTFQLLVGDGTVVATDEVNVFVKDIPVGTGGMDGAGGMTMTGGAGGAGGMDMTGGAGGTTDTVEIGGGCNCRTSGDPKQNGAPAALSAIGLAALLVQRRRRPVMTKSSSRM